MNDLENLIRDECCNQMDLDDNMNLDGFSSAIKFLSVLRGHLRRITKDLKMNGVAQTQRWKCYLTAYINMKRELGEQRYIESSLESYNKYNLLSNNQDLASRYRSLNSDNEKDNFYYNMTIKCFDKFLIEEAIKEGISEPVITEIVQNDNKKASQKLAKKMHVNPLEEDLTEEKQLDL